MLAQKETKRKNVNLFLLKEDETEYNEKAAAAIGGCVCVCMSSLLFKKLLLCFDHIYDFETAP